MTVFSVLLIYACLLLVPSGQNVLDILSTQQDKQQYETLRSSYSSKPTDEDLHRKIFEFLIWKASYNSLDKKRKFLCILDVLDYPTRLLSHAATTPDSPIANVFKKGNGLDFLNAAAQGIYFLASMEGFDTPDYNTLSEVDGMMKDAISQNVNVWDKVIDRALNKLKNLESNRKKGSPFYPGCLVSNYNNGIKLMELVKNEIGSTHPVYRKCVEQWLIEPPGLLGPWYFGPALRLVSWETSVKILNLYASSPLFLDVNDLIEDLKWFLPMWQLKWRDSSDTLARIWERDPAIDQPGNEIDERFLINSRNDAVNTHIMSGEGISKLVQNLTPSNRLDASGLWQLQQEELDEELSETPHELQNATHEMRIIDFSDHYPHIAMESANHAAPLDDEVSEKNPHARPPRISVGAIPGHKIDEFTLEDSVLFAKSLELVNKVNCSFLTLIASSPKLQKTAIYGCGSMGCLPCPLFHQKFCKLKKCECPDCATSLSNPLFNGTPFKEPQLNELFLEARFENAYKLFHDTHGINFYCSFKNLQDPPYFYPTLPICSQLQYFSLCYAQFDFFHSLTTSHSALLNLMDFSFVNWVSNTFIHWFTKSCSQSLLDQTANDTFLTLDLIQPDFSPSDTIDAFLRMYQSFPGFTFDPAHGPFSFAASPSVAHDGEF